MDESQFRRIDEVCDAFDAAWRSGERPCLERYLSRVGPDDQTILFVELLRVEIYRRGLHSDAFGKEKLRPAAPAVP